MAEIDCNGLDEPCVTWTGGVTRTGPRQYIERHRTKNKEAVTCRVSNYSLRYFPVSSNAPWSYRPRTFGSKDNTRTSRVSLPFPEPKFYTYIYMAFQHLEARKFNTA